MKKGLYSLILLTLMTNITYAQSLNTLSTKEKKEGYVLLFDGLSLKGWTASSGLQVPATWEVKNGCIKTVKGGKGANIITVGEYSDFDLSVDFNIEPGCNSGIKYFYTKYETGGDLGIEYQIIDDKLGEDTKQANHLCGSFYDVLAPDESKKKVNVSGTWNTIRIISSGKKVEHWLNGVKILEFSRGEKGYIEAVAKSKFNKTVPAFGMVEKGHILLQEHGGVVSFKNIKIKTL